CSRDATGLAACATAGIRASDGGGARRGGQSILLAARGPGAARRPGAADTDSALVLRSRAPEAPPLQPGVPLRADPGGAWGAGGGVDLAATASRRAALPLRPRRSRMASDGDAGRHGGAYVDDRPAGTGGFVAAAGRRARCRVGAGE